MAKITVKVYRTNKETNKVQNTATVELTEKDIAAKVLEDYLKDEPEWDTVGYKYEAEIDSIQP